MLIAALFTIAKTWKQHKCTSIGEMDKEDIVHIYSEILSIHKKKETMPFAAAWMDLETVILNEVKSDRDKYHVISLICAI